MIRFTVLMATTLIATSSMAYATTPAQPLAPLSPTKDKSVQTQTSAETEAKKAEERLERQKADTRRKSMRTITSRSQEIKPEAARPETGTKGRVHVPSKAVKHESAKNPANQVAPAVPGPSDAPYGN